MKGIISGHPVEANSIIAENFYLLIPFAVSPDDTVSHQRILRARSWYDSIGIITIISIAAFFQ